MDLLTVVLCLLLANLVLLGRSIDYRAREYFWLAMRLRPLFILAPIIVEVVIGLALVVVLTRIIPLATNAHGRHALAAIVGIAVAVSPDLVANWLEPYLNERLAKQTSGTLKFLMNVVQKNFRNTVHALRREDLLDYRENKDPWCCPGSDIQSRNWRLRILYEENKVTIAASFKKSQFLDRDGYPSAQNFYPLVDYFGRERLRDILVKGAVEPRREGWTGREHRLQSGTAADRVDETDETRGKVRIYDNEDFCAAIDRGEVGPDYGGSE